MGCDVGTARERLGGQGSTQDEVVGTYKLRMSGTKTAGHCVHNLNHRHHTPQSTFKARRSPGSPPPQSQEYLTQPSERGDECANLEDDYLYIGGLCYVRKEKGKQLNISSSKLSLPSSETRGKEKNRENERETSTKQTHTSWSLRG